MEPDNFTLHIVDDKVRYFHKDLKILIDSVSIKEKIELENYSKDISKIFGRGIKLTWGFVRADDTIENVLSHISGGDRQDLDLIESDSIEQGYLSYQEHNLTNDMVKAPMYSIITRYISLLNKQAIKIKNLQ